MEIMHLFLFLGLTALVDAQTRSCLTTYANMSIFGSDLNSIQGSASQCCQFCQQNQSCKAWVWDKTSGGTCWLKSATQPIYANSNGSLAGIMGPIGDEIYALNQTYAGETFFDTFNFDHPWHSLTNVTLLVNQTRAQQLGMIGVQNGKVYMGLDHTNIYNGTGRPSITIQSHYLYNSGLFILNLDHMPTGPGTWPAFWTYGPSWPHHGEIDILEGISNFTANEITIHVGEDCLMYQNTSIFFDGTWKNPAKKATMDCYEFANETSTVHKGCSVLAPQGTFNTGFNLAGGGVFALQWESQKFIRVWNFVRPNVPADIVNDSLNPNPDTWGLPTAQFTLGPNCSPDHFTNHTIVFDIALCGAWVAQYYPGGEKACEEAVMFHPELYTEAYWLINYLKVYCKPGEPCGTYEPECYFGC